ncbi:acyl-CoA--6-aminopenicillanic acid acyl-transferase [Brevibacillus reuszeri]|nr:C45 family peptidase [Brevibacillus reuszeri]MED1858749.1 C45 family autoproteolytic acyltransferase/hydrolase [Brevibacillus reuszeri]GED69729.1 acyl-CoA--6-aminopenicillanic acid acyl-transferase [Brevibacillus reuszeri]
MNQKTFPFYRFEGSHREIGRQYGEACADLIRKHRDYALARLEAKVKIPSMQALEEAALRYREYVLKYAPFFDEEIQGISESTGLTLGEAYLLQLRAELYYEFDSNDECTTFAIQTEATADGTPLIGQNADLPNFYSEIGIVAEFVPDDGHTCLMLTPAGQISYIGINKHGLGVFANFLTCDGWRVGFPRYLLSRLALTKETVPEAIALVRSVHRASSRNLILLDKKGNAADLETTPTTDMLIEPVNGLLAHANHYIGQELLAEERLTGTHLDNSKTRYARMRSLLESHHGKLDAQAMQSILRDRGSEPYPLCRMPGDDGTDSITFASVIAEPSKGQLWIAIGPPNQFEYKCYSFS